MISELFLYDRDEGLFKRILEKSSVIEGRYFILPQGNELNAANLGQYISDALNGLQAVNQKYPIALCLPPRSFHEQGTLYLFTMFFLTRSGVTGQNKIKSIDIDTQTSTHHTWYDWKDMGEVAVNFLRALKSVIKEKYSGSTSLRSLMSVSADGVELARISNIGNDNVSGVRLSFRIEMHADCEIIDYAPDAFDDMATPPLNIHPMHKH